MSIKQINDTTFSADGLGDVKPSVLIGGKATDKFIPNVNTSFYDDEFYFNLNAVDCEVIDEAVSADDVLRQNISGQTHEYYIDDNGRLKWDKLFYSCPESMRIRFKVKKSSGINFYYQPELTPEEIADGCERPDDIVGSYAVYCDKANNSYKTGKLCHIPRPFVIDASGNKKWCVMTYEEIRDTEGMLYIDMPEEFMQSAVYPVRLDPTLGYTSAPASGGGCTIRINDADYIAESGGTVTGVFVYAKIASAGSSYLNAGYYTNAGASPSGDPIKTTVTINNTTPQWFSSVLSGSITSDAYYYPALAGPSQSPSVSVYYDSGAGGRWRDSYTLTDLPDDLDVTGWNFSSDVFGIYIEYTKSGGGSGNSYYYQQQQM